MAKKTIILLGFVLLKFILQYVLISPTYDLHRDEYLHLDQANHLAWGYLSVPPVTSWLAFVIKLLGNDVFWVKFFPALLGALTIVVVWKTIEELKGDLFALILGATGVLFSVLLRQNLLFQPNSLDVLCWATLYLVVIKYINSESPKWLYIGAVVFAVGFLNKYNIVFLLIGLLPALLLTRHRTLFVSKTFYLAVLAGLVLVLPNLVWQYLHGFPVIHHMQALSETQLVHVDRWGFVRSQLLFYMGSLFVIGAGLYALLVYRPFQKYRFFFWAFIFTLLVFLYLRAKDYYAIGLYPVYIAFGSVFLGDLLKSGWKRFLQPVAVLLPVLLFIPMYNLVFLNKSPAYILQNQQKYQVLGLLRWEDGQNHPLPQDNADMLGWQELARKVDKVYSHLPDPDKTLVLCDNYGQAGAINYYTKEGIRAVSFNADYLYWFDLDKEYKHLIRVKEYTEREAELKETSLYFESARMADSIINPFAREHGTTIFSFVDTKVDINARIRKEITEVKNRQTASPTKP